jgi:hypothetical protein
MGACAGKDKIVAVDLVEKQPVRLNVAIAVSAPIACQGTQRFAEGAPR